MDSIQSTVQDGHDHRSRPSRPASVDSEVCTVPDYLARRSQRTEIMLVRAWNNLNVPYLGPGNFLRIGLSCNIHHGVYLAVSQCWHPGC